MHQTPIAARLVRRLLRGSEALIWVCLLAGFIAPARAADLPPAFRAAGKTIEPGTILILAEENKKGDQKRPSGYQTTAYAWDGSASVESSPQLFKRGSTLTGSIQCMAVGRLGEWYYSSAGAARIVGCSAEGTEGIIYTNHAAIRYVALDGEDNLYFSESVRAGGDGKIFRMARGAGGYGKPEPFYTVHVKDIEPHSWSGGFCFEPTASGGVNANRLYICSGDVAGASIHRVTRPIDAPRPNPGNWNKPEKIFAGLGTIVGLAVAGPREAYFADRRKEGDRVYRLKDWNEMELVFDAPVASGLNKPSIHSIVAIPSAGGPRSTTAPTSRPTSGPAVAFGSESSTQPSARAATRPVPGPEHDRKLNKLFDFLMSEYKPMLEPNEDRIVRSLALVSVARLPRADATDALMIVLADAVNRIPKPGDWPRAGVSYKEQSLAQDALVASLAWECVLARANLLSDAQFDEWMKLTADLIDRQAFRGELRVALVRLLQAWGPEPRSKAMLAWMFEHTNSYDFRDLSVLVAAGRCIRAWHSADVTEALLNQLMQKDSSYRADFVLHEVGVPFKGFLYEHPVVGTIRLRELQGMEAAQWWRTEKPQWTGPASAPGLFGGRGATSQASSSAPATQPATGWRAAPAHFVPSPQPWDEIDPADKRWRQEMELKRPAVRTLDMAFLLDVTGSMGNAIVWLKHDVANMSRTLQLIAPEPRLGVTFYRDFGDAFVTRNVPINKDLTRLGAELGAMAAAGGGDIPEAVREALLECLKSNPWASDPKTSRVMVLIGDAPPHPQTQGECELIARQAADKNFHLYAIKVVTGFEAEDLTAFNLLADAGHGAVFDIDVRYMQNIRVMRNLYLGYTRSIGLTRGIPGENPNPKPLPDPQAPEVSPTLLSRILADQIDHPYEDRVEPIVRVAWETLKAASQPEKHEDAPPYTPVSGPNVAGPAPKNPQSR